MLERSSPIFGYAIDVIHGTGLETNHVRQLVMYILSGAMRVAVVGNLSIAISICW